jgi:hypothetical protein
LSRTRETVVKKAHGDNYFGDHKKDAMEHVNKAINEFKTCTKY